MNIVLSEEIAASETKLSNNRRNKNTDNNVCRNVKAKSTVSKSRRGRTQTKSRRGLQHFCYCLHAVNTSDSNEGNDVIAFCIGGKSTVCRAFLILLYFSSFLFYCLSNAL